MGKRISLFIATVLSVVAMPVATFAAPAVTDVSGVVTHNGSPVSGASVTVTCNGNSDSNITDGTGTYLVAFAASDCPNGQTATVIATKGPLTGNNSGPVNGITNKLNIAVVDVAVVPEYGIIGLTGAAVIGGGAFMVMRRRQLGDHQA